MTSELLKRGKAGGGQQFPPRDGITVSPTLCLSSREERRCWDQQVSKDHCSEKIPCSVRNFGGKKQEGNTSWKLSQAPFGPRSHPGGPRPQQLVDSPPALPPCRPQSREPVSITAGEAPGQEAALSGGAQARWLRPL